MEAARKKQKLTWRFITAEQKALWRWFELSTEDSSQWFFSKSLKNFNFFPIEIVQVSTFSLSKFLGKKVIVLSNTPFLLFLLWCVSKPSIQSTCGVNNQLQSFMQSWINFINLKKTALDSLVKGKWSNFASMFVRVRKKCSSINKSVSTASTNLTADASTCVLVVRRSLLIIMVSLFLVNSLCMSIIDVGIYACEKVEDNLSHIFTMLVCNQSSASANASSCFFLNYGWATWILYAFGTLVQVIHCRIFQLSNCDVLKQLSA